MLKNVKNRFKSLNANKFWCKISVSKLILGIDFGTRFDFSIKPVLEKRLSIQLYSRQWDEEVSGQVYH